MPQDLHHIQEQTFALLKEVLELMREQQERLDKQQRQIDELIRLQSSQEHQ